MSKKPGRPRKLGERYPSGQLKSKHSSRLAQMTPEQRRAQAPLIWQRIREHGAVVGADERLASVIGRLSLDGTLTDAEAATAVYIGETIGRYERLIGAPKRDAASPAFMRGYKAAMDPYARGDGETIAKFERKVRRAKRAYDKLIGMMPNDRAEAVLYDLCVADKEVNSALYPDLKRLLQAIGLRVGLVRQVAKVEARGVTSTLADARHMAQAMVDAIAVHMERDRLMVQRFEIEESIVNGERGLIVWGSNEAGETVRKVVRMKLRGLLPAVLDAQLVKAAAAKWGLGG